MAIDSNREVSKQTFDVSETALNRLQSDALDQLAGATPCKQADGSSICGQKKETDDNKDEKKAGSLEIPQLFAGATSLVPENRYDGRHTDHLNNNPRLEGKNPSEQEPKAYGRQDDFVTRPPRLEGKNPPKQEPKAYGRQDDFVTRPPRLEGKKPQEEKHSQDRVKG